MRTNRAIKAMGLLLAASMAVTEGLLVWQGRWTQAIPLHLCSLSAMAAFAAAMGLGKDGVIEFLWYLGAPGALLALVFPAPAASRCQVLFTASSVLTHALIVLIALALLRVGRRPRPGRAARMMMKLQGIALVSFIVNGALGTNFLFLAAPPAGTPLEIVYAWGAPAYILTLEGMMLLLCLFQGRLLRLAERSEARSD